MGKFKIQCDTQAPVLAEESITIKAEHSVVMSTLINISMWSDWRSEVSNVKLLSSEVKEGVTFKWSSNGLRYNSTIHTLSQNYFGWTGKTIGAYAVHNWYVEKLTDSKSLVVVQESLSGWSVSLLRKRMARELPNLLKKDLNELKYECERKK